MITNLHSQEELQVLKNNFIGNLGYISEQCPYVIPITYFFDQESKSIISYSAEGHKIESMREHKYVSLQVADIRSLNQWKSVLVHGEYNELSGSGAKHALRTFADGVKKIIKETTGEKMKYIEEFSSKVSNLESPIVYKINIIEIDGKERLT